ncbi:hypothetical protein GOB83_13910 [Acetobacter fabarum]|uniref:hypothetical protein n=1 Tax=Acetobacter fabarum TaxID=483199 RepID=UPI001404C44C|nr:hypothetical protein [Acetobacter fabarum]NHO43247.1 hypothetical protein [Acetobacter fabarum]
MMDHEEHKVLKLFELFSDIEFQKNSWFGFNHSASSPDELCNNIDDINLITWVNKNESIHPLLCEYIKIFIKNVEELPDTQEPFSAFSSKEWISLRLKASIILAFMRRIFK